MKRTSHVVLLVLGGLLAGPRASLTGATILVDPAGGGDFTEIQAALDAAQGGDTVLVNPGEYLTSEPFTYRGKKIALKSVGGPDATTIRMAEVPADPARPWIVAFEAGEGPEAVLEGFTLTGPSTGLVSTGGSAPTIISCTIARNASAGASVGEGSSMTLIDSRVVGNGAGVSCGEQSGVSLTGSTIAGNAGTGIEASTGASVTVDGCDVSGNSGHGLSTCNGTFTIHNSTIAANCKTGAYSHCGSSRLEIDQSTVAGNGDCGFRGGWTFLSSCIVWGNLGGFLRDGTALAMHSCIQGGEGYHGLGDISEDPLFCGWVGGSEVYADASSPGPGNGSEGSPYRDLRFALDGYSFALSAGSPCIGSGEGGANMGADHGICGVLPTPSRTVRLAPGTYGLEGKTLSFHVSLDGAGEDQTFIEGTAAGLRGGSSLRDLTVTKGSSDGIGILIASGESPEISSATISGNGTGIACDPGSSPELTDCTIRENETGVLCSGSSATFRRCKILANKARGMTCADGDPDACGGPAGDLLEGCTISDNLGPGVTCGRGCAPTLTNCVISGNAGHGVVCETASVPVLTNLTVAASHGTDKDGAASAGIYLEEESAAFIESCIVWGNEGGSILEDPGALAFVSSSCLEDQGVWTGPGNIAEDPLFCAWGSRGETWVDASRPGPGDGSQESPYPDLKSALGYSFALSKGSPCIGSGAGGSDMGADLGVCEARGASALIVHVAPGAYSLEGRTLASHVSLEGSGEEETVVEGTVVGLRTGASLSDLTVTKGTAWGIVVSGAESPEISNVTISGCSGVGVACLDGASPRLKACTIARNRGLGLDISAASPILVRCTILGNITISGNSTTYQCGGVLIRQGSSPVLQDCLIAENSLAGGGAGGVRVESGSHAILTGCIIQGNRTDRGTGGLSVRDSSGSFANCRIVGNWAEYAGAGGVRIVDDAAPELANLKSLINCLISGNLASGRDTQTEEEDVGGVEALSSNASIVNCTISGNAAPGYGAIRCDSGSPSLTNCIIWGNTPNTVCGTRSNCLTRSSDDPLFVNPGVFDFTRFKTVTIGGQEVALPDFIVEEPDYHLRAGSPAIDAGTADGAPETDIEGNPRPCGAGVDIGAHELCEGSGGTAFQRGDSNADGAVDISDAVAILNYLFGTKVLPCLDAADTDGSGVLELSDAVKLLGFLFLGTAAPADPFGKCGIPQAGAGGKAAGLGCEQHSPCL